MTACNFCSPALTVPSLLPALSSIWDEGFAIVESSSTPYFIAKAATPLNEIGFPYHSSLESLVTSAEKCPLCKAVLENVKRFQDGLESVKRDTHKKYFVLERQGHGSPDNWTFSLVKRLDGADGFSVVSNSKRERLLYLMGSFGFCVEPSLSESSISQTTDVSPGKSIRGVRVNSNAGAEDTLDVAKGWIRDCVQNHHTCIPPRVKLPSRILDLNAFDDPGKVRLWETQGQESGSYITLSYCWGSDASVHKRTTHSTLSEHLESIEVDSLPQTYKDAIQITRSLGLRYLWIDSLCICQDDPDDWARESAAMQQVYAGAYLTIAADKASSLTDGFLIRSKREHVPTKLKVSSSENVSDVADISAYSFEVPAIKTCGARSWMELDKEPTTYRAWAMQERLLPQRLLHFASDQLYFECNRHFLSEDGVKVLGRWNSVYPGVEKSFSDIARKSMVSITHQLWYLILENYTGRQLTVKSDRLPAISGLAALIKQKLNSKKGPTESVTEYVAGLWSDALIEGLRWTVIGRRSIGNILPDARPLPGELEYIAPTWSPASFDGRSAHGMTMPGWVNVAVAKEFSVTPKNKENPLGELVDGSITLCAPMIKMELSEIPDEDEAKLGDWRRNMRLCTPRGSAYGAYSSFDCFRGQSTESRDWVKNNSIFALILSEGRYLERQTEGNTLYHALLVIRVSEARRARAGREEFRRIGTIHLDSECIGSDEDIVKDVDGFREVVII
ncbi:het-domain protein [Fusarium beomiforme]|uniref:Het-domain protein n=1 Tax=Fusarium beomiforme TaxID=44412 RepID=A0A9P5A685_9HYPO|nr:het-domain protein [Fusarium beomiforme]